jgi:hypothetical protein
MLCTVNYNAASGSDTAASGSNAPVTALTDANTGATVTTAGSTSVTFSSTIDLTGVNNDGSDVIWINTTAGTRHLFRIVTFTGGVATCTGLVLAETASTSQSGLSWAIGGKRQTLKNDATQPDAVDWTDGWCAQFDPGTYLVSSWRLSGGSDEVGPILIKSTDGLTATPAIWDADGTVDMPELGAGLFRIEGMEFRGAAWRGGLEALASSSTSFYGNRFRSGGSNSTCLTINGSNYNPTVIENNEFVVGGSSGERGLVSGASRAAVYIRGNYFHGTNVLASIGGATTDSSMCVVEENLFVGNGTAAGVTWTGSNNMSLVVNSNIFYNCSTGAYIEKPSTGSVNGMRSVRNNIFEGCTTGVWTDADILATRAWAVDHNAFYNNTTDRTNVRVGDNDVSLTASPFVNAASDDFRLNALSGGGLECRGVVPRGPQFLASFTEDIGPFSTPISLLAANEVRPTALVGHWSASLDDDGAGTTTATDLSGNGHNGTKNGGLTEVSDPSFNGVRAWDMDGTDDYISIPDDDAFSFGNGTTDSPFSISTWVYVHTFDPVITPLVSKNSDFNRGEWYFSISNTQALQLTLIDDSLLGRCWRVGSGKTLSTNEWIHVVVTYDGSGSSTGIKFYVNGEEVSSLDNSNGSYVAMENLSDAVQIGRRDTGYELDGKVDDTRIYNAVLSVDEVQALAASRVGREPLTDQNWKDVLDGMTQWIDGTVWYSLYPNFYYSLLNGQRWQGSGATWSRGTHPCGGNTIQTLTAGITTRLALPSVTVEQVQPLAESFYLCAWVKLADVSLRPQTIFAKHDTSTTERSVLFRVNSDGGALILVNKVGDGPNNIPLNSPGGYITDNTWAFVEGWRDTVNETLNLAINRTEFSMALSNGSLHDSAADGALFKQEDNADAFDVGELFGFAMIIGAIPSAENRDWIYNSGVGRTLEDWQRRQLRTPIEQVIGGGGGGGTKAFGFIG